MNSILFNAHHSPIGAFASFTLGQPGPLGGLGLELGKPADQSIFLGVEAEPQTFHLLPFFKGSDPDAADDRARYEAGNSEAAAPISPSVRLQAISSEAITRDFKLCTDRWSAPGFDVEITSPVLSVPDPEGDSPDLDGLRRALLPAVFVTLSVDNRAGDKSKRIVFGFEDNHLDDTNFALRRLDDTSGGRFTGIGQGRSLAIVSRDEGIVSGQGFTISDILTQSVPENLAFGLGRTAALIGTVASGQQRTFTFAVCFYRGGLATVGLDTTYYYTRFWDSLEAVADDALTHVAEYRAAAETADQQIEDAALSDDQRFMLIHAIRSYYGSTQFLQDTQGRPLWIVNEGEYRMMNTLDLTADQLFYEMAMNPWTVRNELDLFADRYSYTDSVYFPGTPEELHDGGISFTHDMGVANVFSRPAHSIYEMAGLTGCFSYMTHEELVNWVLCAMVYGEYDPGWLDAKLPLLEQCLTSMVNRDNPAPSLRTGIMSLESERCKGGAEITTYDSLDPSLGQSRGNGYLAGKCWAAYVGFRHLFEARGKSVLADLAHRQATICAASICASAVDGILPAIVGEDVPAQIIPAIEGLIFPAFIGCSSAVDPAGEYGEYALVLKGHLEQVLKPGVCLFPEGGWKLSSTSDNSWLSKIYLCQYIARELLNVHGDRVTRAADQDHVRWLLDPQNTYWCWSDQMVAGSAVGSKYYPRGVTAWLWLSESGQR